MSIVDLQIPNFILAYSKVLAVKHKTMHKSYRTHELASTYKNSVIKQ